MTKEVLINISGLHMGATQEDDIEQESPIEVLVPGNYYFKDGKHYLFFEERIEGFQEVTKSQIKWQGNDYLEVTKKGLTNMNMVYEKNKKTQCFYNTPYGQLNLGIFTSDIVVNETEEDIDIRVEYAMDANHQLLAECTICINVKPRESKKFSIFND